jgi:hypothetical protein
MHRRRELAGLAGAIFAHGAAFACFAAGGPLVGPLAAPPPPTEIEVEETPAPDRPAEASVSVPVPTPVHVPLSALPPTPSLTPALPPTRAPTPADLPPLDLASPVSLSADQLGLGERRIFLGQLPDHPAPSASPAPEGIPNVAPGAQQSVRDALRAGDHALGLDVGGPIVGVAEELVRPSNTPVDSHAVFQITVDASGNVIGVVLLDASEARGAWERVASKLAGALRSRRLTMRGHPGAVITLDVTSRWVMPSGSKPGKPLSNSRVGPSGTGVTFSASYDVTDLATRPQRSVHARIVGERFP